MQRMLCTGQKRWTWLAGIILGVASAYGAATVNPLEVTNANYTIAVPTQQASVVPVTTTNLNPGAAVGMDDNLVWSHSGRLLAIDRTDTNLNVGQTQDVKYIYILNVNNLSNIAPGEARNAATNFGVLANITDFTYNDDRVLFGFRGQGKTKLMSCAATGATQVVTTFLADSASGSNAVHVFSPSTIFDAVTNKERLLFLTSSSTNQNPAQNVMNETNARLQVWTAPYASGGVPDWSNKVALTAFTNLYQIESVRWCPELGTNGAPLMNRYALVLRNAQSTNPPPPNTLPPGKRLVVFTGARDILEGRTNAPTQMDTDTRFSVRDPQASDGSQVSWTFNGDFLLYSKDGYYTNALNPTQQATVVSGLALVSSVGTNPGQQYAVASNFAGQSLQWLNFSPDGMRVAFTANKNAYILPITYQNTVQTGGATNVLSDGGYTTVVIPGSAVGSNLSLSIQAPNSVNTNGFPGAYLSGSAREFTFSGLTNAGDHYNFATNVELSLYVMTNNLPPGGAETNLTLFRFEPAGVTNGQTGVWMVITSRSDPTNHFVSGSVTSFSIYAVGVPSATAASTNTGATNVATAAYETNALAGDFDGDGRDDFALYQEATGDWHLKLSAYGYGHVLYPTTFGGDDFAPLTGDFDGDHRDDFVVYDERNGYWYFKLSGMNYQTYSLVVTFGGTNYTPVVGNFDGDQYADLGIYDQTSFDWTLMLSSWGYGTIAYPRGFGAADYDPVAGDFDGDGYDDFAVQGESNGNWYLKPSSYGYLLIGYPSAYGAAAEPVAGDFDGDGADDFAYFTGGDADDATGHFHMKLSTANYMDFSLQFSGLD